MVKHFIIREDVAQAIANYLQERPYREVVGMLAALANLQPMPDTAESTGDLPSKKKEGVKDNAEQAV